MSGCTDDDDDQCADSDTGWGDCGSSPICRQNCQLYTTTDEVEVGSTECTWPWLNGNTFCFERRPEASELFGGSSRRLEEESEAARIWLEGERRMDEEAEVERWGCMAPVATNYDSTATRCSGCIVPLFGCTDSSAANFESDATAGSAEEYCDYTPIVNGCTDPIALNYNQNATRSSGCKYLAPFAAACSDPNAANYAPDLNSLTSESDGITASLWRGECAAHVVGCTDPRAANFNRTRRSWAAACTFDFPATWSATARNTAPTRRVTMTRASTGHALAARSRRVPTSTLRRSPTTGAAATIL